MTHADKAGMWSGDVLVEGDHRYAGFLGLAYHRRHAGRIGRLQDDEVDALADERLDLAGLLLDVALAVLDADVHSEPGALSGALVAPVLDQRMRKCLEDDTDVHPLRVDHLAGRSQYARSGQTGSREAGARNKGPLQELTARYRIDHSTVSLFLDAVGDGSAVDVNSSLQLPKM